MKIAARPIALTRARKSVLTYRTPTTSRALALTERTIATKAHARDSGPERRSRYALNKPRLYTPVFAGSKPLRVGRLAAFSGARIKRLEVVAPDRVPTLMGGEGDGRRTMPV